MRDSALHIREPKATTTPMVAKRQKKKNKKTVGSTSENNASAGVFLHFGIFLCRSLQNNNVN